VHNIFLMLTQQFWKEGKNIVIALKFSYSGYSASTVMVYF
jgi:hypothetical protein